MQIVLKNRDSLTGASTIYTPPVNVSGFPLITLELIAHEVSGTTPDMTVTFQSSDNLQDWSDVGQTIARISAGSDSDALKASADFYGQYLRAKIVATGTSPYFNYSLFLNTFASS